MRVAILAAAAVLTLSAAAAYAADDPAAPTTPPAAGAPDAAAAAPAAPAAGAPDAAHGQGIFREQCGLCHTAAAGDGDGGMGPDLAGVVGRPVGSGAGYDYTDALKKLNTTSWTEDSLNTFLADPQAYAPGTGMPVSISDPKERADLVHYLASVPKK